MFVDILLNDGFIGDNQQVYAVSKQIVASYPNIVKIAEFKDNDPNTALTLTKNYEGPEPHILILSGSHGLEFLNQGSMRSLIESKKPIVVWVGHQNPGLLTVKNTLQIVALPQYIIESEPELKMQFFNRLVPMQGVPNSLTELDLQYAKQKWNEIYPDEAIYSKNNNLVGIFLGGDAPESNGSLRYWSDSEAEQQGFNFGIMALQENKHLLICNGPRTSKFYPNSPDLKSPVQLQFDENSHWIPLDKLSEEKRLKPEKTRIAHAPNSPLDPVSAAFLKGLEKSGLPKGNYQFFDFKFGETGKPAKSAYKAIISALYNSQNPIAFYSGESISYAELAYFIPRTYAFRTGSMNKGHEMALEQFQHAGMIVEYHFNQPLSAQIPKVEATFGNVKGKQDQDAQAIARKITSLLQTGEKALNIEPLTLDFDRQKQKKSDNKETPISEESIVPTAGSVESEKKTTALLNG